MMVEIINNTKTHGIWVVKTCLMTKNAPELDSEGWESRQVKLEKKVVETLQSPLTVDRLGGNCYKLKKKTTE